MTRLLLLTISAFAAAAALADKHDTDPLETVVQGWSLGSWTQLNHVFLDEKTREWGTVENSPWSEWDVKALSATLVEVAMSDGSSHRVEITDSEYRDFGDVDENGETGEPLVIPIIETTVNSSQDWRILLQWPNAGQSDAEEPRYIQYSELSMAGDMFSWANWVGTSPEDMFRVSISVNRIKRE